MLDLQQGLPRNHLSSFNPVYQASNNHADTTIIDFDFWDSRKNTNYANFDDFGGSEIEFQAQTIEDGFEAYSPPLWKTSKSIKNEVYPLLPHNHRYSNLSPGSRTQAIAKGRGELMKMIQNMPESSYELSLKDIVDQEIFQEAKQESITEDPGFDFKTEVQIKQKKKKKKNGIKTGQISRTGSMDNETFLLKMFFPICIPVNRKSRTRNRSEVSPRSSFEGSENHVRTEWWKKKNFLGENKTSGKNRNGGSTSSSSSNSNSNSSTRHADENFLPGCWPFFHTKKSKTRRQGMPLLNGSSI